MELPKTNCFLPDYGVAKVEEFGALYPVINNYILNNQESEESRAGDAKELLDIKTIITNPIARCVGGYGRDINIFFLLAEAMWIAVGRKDLEFLETFNARMKDFSDDGKTFHAPYGFRLRHWGIRTEDKYENGVTAAQGYDQVADAVRLLSENMNTRQVVMSIWNPSFDLGAKSKDIPCNDLIKLKVRKGKLITTIANRSNDLHWGLPTNIFQFSFITEIMCRCLGIELGTQTHNSQSLHIYDWNGTAKKMDEIYQQQGMGHSLYEATEAEARPMDFAFSHEVAVNRLREVDANLNIVIENLMRVKNGETDVQDEIKQLQEFSTYFYNVYQLLKIYVLYKQKMTLAKTTLEKDAIRKTAIAEIELLEAEGADGWDMSILAKNFFAARLSKPMKHKYLGKL